MTPLEIRAGGLGPRARPCDPLPFPGPMRALSVRAPWSYSLAAGYKPIENRRWKPPLGNGPIWLAIHASLTIDPVVQVLEKQIGAPIAIVTGAVIGAMRIDDVVAESSSPWFIGPLGWTLSHAVLFDEPIHGVLGSLRIFSLLPAAERLLEPRWSGATFFSWRS